eukprot:767305-Hanusia_phi.AAC.1
MPDRNFARSIASSMRAGTCFFTLSSTRISEFLSLSSMFHKSRFSSLHTFRGVRTGESKASNSQHGAAPLDISVPDSVCDQQRSLLSRLLSLSLPFCSLCKCISSYLHHEAIVL